jgi:hypothetical protein
MGLAHLSKKREVVTLDRRNPPFAAFAKNGMGRPQVQRVGVVTLSGNENTIKKERHFRAALLQILISRYLFELLDHRGELQLRFGKGLDDQAFSIFRG